jgi:hypothetical protein
LIFSSSFKVEQKQFKSKQTGSSCSPSILPSRLEGMSMWRKYRTVSWWLPLLLLHIWAVIYDQTKSPTCQIHLLANRFVPLRALDRRILLQQEYCCYKSIQRQRADIIVYPWRQHWGTKRVPWRSFHVNDLIYVKSCCSWHSGVGASTFQVSCPQIWMEAGTSKKLKYINKSLSGSKV